MSSREIAELTGKAHKDVLRDTRRMLEDLEMAERNFARGYLDANKQERPEYHLPKDLSICLVAGYDAKLRLTIIRRWDELEKAAQAGTLTAPSDDTLAPRITSLERAVMDLTRMVGGLVNRPAQVSLRPPRRALIIPLTQPLSSNALPFKGH